MDVTHGSFSATVSLEQADPTRPPDCRWRAAQKLLESGRPALPSRYDSPTRELLDYLRRRQRCRGERDLQRLATALPHLNAAVLLRERANRSLLDVIEARILAGQAPDQIALLVGIPAETIATYEALCYDVRNRLVNGDYVHQQLVQGATQGSSTTDTSGPTLKLLAYLGGPAALDQVLPATIASESGSSSDCLAALDSSARVWLEAQVNLAVRQGEEGGKPAKSSSLVALAQRRHAERPTDNTTSKLESALNEMFQSLPFGIGPGDRLEKCPALREYDEAGVALTPDEELVILLGGVPKNHDSLLSMQVPANGGIGPD